MLALLSRTADRHKFQDNAARNDHSLGYAERAWQLLVEAYAAGNFDGSYLQGLCVMVQYDMAELSGDRDIYSLDSYSLDARGNKLAGIASVNLDLMCLAGEIFRSLDSDFSTGDKPFWMGSSARGALSSRLLEVETKSAHHSYTSTGPVTRVLQEPHLKPYFRERTIYHLLDSACYCYLNHEFVIFMQARHVQTRLPLTFLQQSYHTARLYADWIFRLVMEMQEAGLQLYEPFTGYLVAIGASIHLEHASNESTTTTISSKEKFDKCLGFVERLAEMWPNMEKLVQILKKLRIRFRSVRTLRYVDGQYDGAQPKCGFREVSLPEEDIQLMKVLLDYAATSKYNDHADCQADTTHAEDYRRASSGPETGNFGLTDTSASYTAESLTQGVPSDAMSGTQWDSTNAWSLFGVPWSEYYPLDPTPGPW
ncbi:uncharacterized protein RHO25_011174 [Cercospora beticola]|uniref:Transcription factor domain-containing protein n=1 Tax=Cercospora beticola TaxID=122368 RepID=A0ABZ0P3T0_CERBT|nr:hypothetical protein RHO25_011174 [Cercospora beticola]